jgi:hypothetical protein
MEDANPHPPPRRRQPPRKLAIYYGDVRIGTIGERAGVPVDVDPWGWSCGFYPGLDPGQHRSGSAATFDQARADFEQAWRDLLPKIPDGAFEEYRRDRAGRAQIVSARERGEKLPSELPSSFMRCVCGAKFDSNRPDESLPHRRHIYAANGIPR